MNRLLGTASLILILLTLSACSSFRSAAPSPDSIRPSDKELNDVRRGPNGSVISAEEAKKMEASFRRSLGYLKRGNPDKAQTLLEELSKSYNDQSVIFNALGIVYKQQGMMEEAVAAYKQAIDLQDDLVEAHFNLGLSYRESGKFPEAEAAYLRAISLNPEFAPAHYNLGILYDLYMNRPEDALRHYKEYRKLEGSNKKLKIWIKDLDRRIKAQMAKDVTPTEGGGP